MSAPTVDDLAEATDELLAARIVWVEAKQRRALRDSHANRVAEEAARVDMDAALDLWCDCRGDCE